MEDAQSDLGFRTTPSSLTLVNQLKIIFFSQFHRKSNYEIITMAQYSTTLFYKMCVPLKRFAPLYFGVKVVMMGSVLRQVPLIFVNQLKITNIFLSFSQKEQKRQLCATNNS